MTMIVTDGNVSLRNMSRSSCIINVDIVLYAVLLRLWQLTLLSIVVAAAYAIYELPSLSPARTLQRNHVQHGSTAD